MKNGKWKRGSSGISFSHLPGPWVLDSVGAGPRVCPNKCPNNHKIEEEEITANLVTGFPVENLTHTENFLSLLFYFGLLSIKEKRVENQELVLQIPNETIRRLFYDYIKEGYEETGKTCPGHY